MPSKPIRRTLTLATWLAAGWRPLRWVRSLAGGAQ